MMSIGPLSQLLLRTAPYRVPAQFDISRIEALVNAKLAEAEDHIWSLREDPTYFRDFVLDWSQHQPENLSSIDGKRHPYLGKPRFWHMVFRNMIEDAYGNLLMWSLTQKQLIEVAALRDHYIQILTSLELPDDYQLATDHFFHLVRRIRENGLWISHHAFLHLRHYDSTSFATHFKRQISFQ